MYHSCDANLLRLLYSSNALIKGELQLKFFIFILVNFKSAPKIRLASQFVRPCDFGNRVQRNQVQQSMGFDLS